MTAFTGSALPKIRAILVDTDELQQNQANFATATGFSTFDPTTDTVANVTLVATTTDLTNGGGGGGLTAAQAAELSGIKAKTDILTFNGTDVKSTLDGEVVVTDTASRNASKADVSTLSTFDPANDTVANVTLVATTTSNTDMRGTDNVIVPGDLSTFDPATDTVANVTLVGTTTDLTNGGLTVGQATELSGIKAKTDILTFNGTDVKATLDGEVVVTDTASRNASKADVSGLSTFNPTTDAVANVTLVATTTTNTDQGLTEAQNTTLSAIKSSTDLVPAQGTTIDSVKSSTDLIPALL